MSLHQLASDMQNNSLSVELHFFHVMSLLGQSLALGLLLMLLNFFVNMWVARKIESVKHSPTDLLLGASNMLFLSVSMTSLMILVNNNIARAFAIGAAIALIRFKGKLTGKSSDTALLFGVLVGMAFGVDQSEIAWLIGAIYVVLQLITVSLVTWTHKMEIKPAAKEKSDSVAKPDVVL